MKEVSVPDQFFTSFDTSTDSYVLPEIFTLLLKNEPHPLCLLAAKQLQHHLTNQEEWQHNFGLSNNKEVIIGKMFGVLVVTNQNNQVGYLSAFSGKLAGGNHHAKFVPPVFDSLTNNSFLNNGMEELTRINNEIKSLEALQPETDKKRIAILKILRKDNSVLLQKELFDNYHFRNQAGEQKSLREIFSISLYKNPPSGAGECAAPKLLQYAFQHNMQPIALAEFWWGLSPKSDLWKHGQYYPYCTEKCGPILAHMLTGIMHELK
jgi:tRNA pseudouridine32 synthase/23S rRNA pseudouridine746 synthase